MLWSWTGTRVRRGLKDVLRSGVAGTRGKGWIIARAIALCGAVSGLVIIDAAGASLSLFRLDPSAAAAQGSPLGEETWSQEVGGGSALCQQRREDVCGKRQAAGSCSGEAANHDNSRRCELG